ncbi:Vgb family protein [Maricaulis sp. CAU 1757]
MSKHHSHRFVLLGATSLAMLTALTACSQPVETETEVGTDTEMETGTAIDDAAGPRLAEDTTRPADGVTPPENDRELAAVDIQEWNVPWEGRPRDPYTLDGETVWFVGQENSYIATLDVADGSFDRIDLRDGAGPHNLIVGEDGRVWYAGNRDAHIGIYDPQSGSFDYVELEGDGVADPHTQIFDDEGHVWFTSQRGNTVSRLDMQSRDYVTLDVPTARARPYGIVQAPDGTIWVALFGTNKLASVDPQTMTLTEHQLPDDSARPRRIGVTSDGHVWYGDYENGRLGRLDPASGEIEEWPLPSAELARPYAMAIDGRDRVWLVETGIEPNYLVGFDPAQNAFTSVTAIPSTGGVVRHMQYLPQTNEIWFGSDMGTIGRASLPD